MMCQESLTWRRSFDQHVERQAGLKRRKPSKEAQYQGRVRRTSLKQRYESYDHLQSYECSA